MYTHYIRGALVILSHTSDFKHPSAAKQPDPNRVFAITPPLLFWLFLAMCVFAYAKREFSVYIFIIFVTCFWPSSAVVPQKSTQNVENCSDASKKPSCEEDGMWQKRENTQKYKFMFISSPSARDKNLENFSSCFFVTHQNFASRLREITGFTSAQIPPQKSSK